MKTSQKIIEYIREHRQVTGQELTDFLGITDRGVRKQLFTLLKQGVLTKKGHPPIVYYQINDSLKEMVELSVLPKSIIEVIDQNYLYITPTGEKLVGLVGFKSWCKKQNLPLEKTSYEYVAMLEKFAQYKKRGFIDGLAKLLSCIALITKFFWMICIILIFIALIVLVRQNWVNYCFMPSKVSKLP